MPEATTRPNRLARTLSRLNAVPAPLRPLVRNLVLRRAVPFTGTARLDFAVMTPEKVEIAIANQRRVQNHIQGVHAAAMTLLAETATGMVVGMNVRDDCLPLAKELKVQFKRRTKGDMRAVAQLTTQQRQLMQTQDKGEVVVPVTVTDASGEEPIVCEFIWAWVPLTKKPATSKPRSVPA
jgi:acyl-coenzyme A thioesterase PaaI-like protein